MCIRDSLHVGDLELDGLVGADGLAEGVTFLRVGDRLVHAALREPRAQRGDRHPALVQDAQELRVAAPLLAQQVRGRDPDVGEGQLTGV